MLKEYFQKNIFSISGTSIVDANVTMMATKDAFMRRGFRIGVEGAPLIKLTALEVLAHTILPNRISKKLVIKRLKDRIPLG